MAEGTDINLTLQCLRIETRLKKGTVCKRIRKVVIMPVPIKSNSCYQKQGDEYSDFCCEAFHGMVLQ